MDNLCKWILACAVVLVLVATACSFSASLQTYAIGAGAIGTSLAALAIGFHSKMKTYAFAAWVVCFVLLGFLQPHLFLKIGPIKGTDSLNVLIQIAMFGMGATLTSRDFMRVFRMPKSVALGFVFQFSFMPVLGWAVATLLQLPAEIAAGVILIGACPGGVSSNVITYLAKGNVALSVTITACTTLASPIMTPTMMYLYAGKSVSIDYLKMFESICMTVVAPILAGLICNAIINRQPWAKQADRYLAILSMIAICFICGIIAASSSGQIQKVGGVLVLAVLIHNTAGYALGYWASKLFGVDEADSRTIAIEVGLQNGGMAAMLATNVLKLPSAALAPAIFAPLMNVTGSLLAAWWSRSAMENQSSSLPTTISHEIK